MKFNPDGTVELKFQDEEYQRPTYQPKPGYRPLPRGTGGRVEPGTLPEKKVKVKALPPAPKPRPEPKPKAEKKARPVRGEKNRERDEEIVRLMKAGATSTEVGRAVGLKRQRVLQIFREKCPDYKLGAGPRAKQVIPDTIYGQLTVLESSRYYLQKDGSMSTADGTGGLKSHGTAYTKCRCTCRPDDDCSRKTCSRCAKGGRTPFRPQGKRNTPLSPAELALARSLAPPAQ